MVHGGLFYKARWWNSATQPSPDATDDVWEVLGTSCDGIQVEAVVAEEDSDEDNNVEEDTEDENEVDPHVPEDHEGPPTLQMAEAREAQLTDTPLFRLVKASIETLKSRKVDKVKAGRKANPDNVKRVESILSAKDWEYIFAMRDPAYSYARFLQAVAKFPSLCGKYTDGRDSDQICRYDTSKGRVLLIEIQMFPDVLWPRCLPTSPRRPGATTHMLKRRSGARFQIKT